MTGDRDFQQATNMKSADLLVGYEIEGYKILDMHEGKFAKVVIYQCSENHDYRAIRFLIRDIDLQKSKDAEIYAKFQEECEILLRIGTGRHPNIVRIMPPQLHNKKAFTEIEYIDGCDLLRYIDDNQSFLPIGEVINFAKNIASALAYCHKGADVIHNDLHSKNVMRRKSDGAYILLDFGLAVQNGKVVRASILEHGDRQYRAPERWDPDKSGKLPDPTACSDVYSFGILMYEALTGDVPFPVNTLYSIEQQLKELREAHKNGDLPDIFNKRKEAYEEVNSGATYVKDYPIWLENVILKCLKRNPDERFEDGRELFLKIEEGFSGIPLEQETSRERVAVLEHNSSLQERVTGLEHNSSLLKKKLMVSAALCCLLFVILIAAYANDWGRGPEEYKVEISQLKKENTDLNTSIRTKVMDIQRLEKEIQNMTPDADRQNKVIRDLEAQLSSARKDIEEKNRRISELEKNPQQSGENSLAAETIRYLEVQLASARKGIEETNRRISELKKNPQQSVVNSPEIENLLTQIQQWEDYIEALQKRINEVQSSNTEKIR